MIFSQAKKVVVVTPPAAIVDNAAITTTAIDTLGFNYCDVYVVIGATDIAMAALKLQQSDASGSGYADVSGFDFSVAAVGTLPSATADNTVVHMGVDLRGMKRYLDVVATGGDGTSGAYFTILAFLSNPEQWPSTATARGFGQEALA